MRTATRILKEGHPNFASPLEAMKRDATIHRACRLATETHDAVVFEVWAWRKLVRPTLEWGQLPPVVGYVTLQLLPRWMGRYRSASNERLKARRAWCGRKCVGEGKGGSGRVDRGGRRGCKTKINK